MLAAVRRGVASRLAAPKRALSTAVSVPAVTLRYFDSRGRAQALRYALVDAGIAFEDERVSLEEISSGKWASMKSNPALTGPWGTLPVLDWGDLRIGQTEAIAAHLFRELSDDAADAAQASRRAAQCAELTSLAHQDILVMCLQLINITATMQAQFAHSQQQQGSLATAASSEAAKAQLDANIANSVMQCKGRVLGVLPRLEMLLATNGAASAGDEWVGVVAKTAAPTVGDMFVFEALEVVSLVLGEEVLKGFPLCSGLCQRVHRRPRISDYIQSGRRPLFLTGSPMEGDVLTSIAAAAK